MKFSSKVTMIGFLLLLALAVVSGAQARLKDSSEAQLDIVHFKNGQQLDGLITEETETHITILFRGGELVLPRRRIDRIIRGERAEVASKAGINSLAPTLPLRDEMYFIYYRGRCVGWRHSTLRPEIIAGVTTHSFQSRTVFRDAKGETELDIRVIESVGPGLRPRQVSLQEDGPGFSTLSVGEISDGQLSIRRSPGKQTERVVLFRPEVELRGPLLRRLADMTHFPDEGTTFRTYDTLNGEFHDVLAKRSLRKEIVAGSHQLVTVWRFSTGSRRWEVWIDTHGGIVREELGGAHMVALRAPSEEVLAWSRGETSIAANPDLCLEYENKPRGFSLSRPNLSWSFEFPEADSPHAITLVEPTLQASLNVVVLEGLSEGCAPETVVMDLLGRWEHGAERVALEYQKPCTLADQPGIRVAATMKRKGVIIRTVADVCNAEGRVFIVLRSAPLSRYHEVRDAFERIDRSLKLHLKTPERSAATID